MQSPGCEVSKPLISVYSIQITQWGMTGVSAVIKTTRPPNAKHIWTLKIYNLMAYMVWDILRELLMDLELAWRYVFILLSWLHTDMKTLFDLVASCEENQLVTVGFPSEKFSNGKPWCFLCCSPEQAFDQLRCRWLEKSWFSCDDSNGNVFCNFSFRITITNDKMMSSIWVISLDCSEI